MRQRKSVKLTDHDVIPQVSVATEKEAVSKLGIDGGLIYMEDDTYLGNPYQVLGEVFLVKSKNGTTPTSLYDENAVFENYALSIPCVVDEQSKLKEPMLRSSIIVDRQLSANVGFLSYLSAGLGVNDYYSLMVFDQATGLLDKNDSSWTNGFKQWKIENADLMEDDSIFCIFVITGFVQKNVIRKKYKKYDGKLKGGYFGVNINGEISISTEEYSLDIRFGVKPAIIKSFSKPKGEAIRNLQNVLIENGIWTSPQAVDKKESLW